MDDLIENIRQLLLGTWRRRWIAMAVAWPAAIVVALVLTRVPDRFLATARVYVDTQTVLKPLMKDLTFQPDIDQQVKMLAKTLISRPNVQRMLTSLPELGMSGATGPFMEAEIDRLIKAIVVEPSSNNMYTISYKDADPKRAQKVVQGLVDRFVDSGLGEKQRDSEEASRFIAEQIQSYEVKLGEAENRLKEFKLRNFGLTGTSNQDYFARVSTLSDTVSKLRLDLGAAEQSRDAFRRELAGEDPQLPADSGAAAAAPTDTDVRLDAQRKLLDDLLRRYTDDHPDVIATRRTIAQLERQKRLESEPGGRVKGRGNAATSPVYQQLRISLAGAEANVASLRSQLSVQSAKLEETRANAGKVPEVEAELAQLNRDYDILRKNYDQLVARRESASLGVKLDQSAQLADFRIVEPPRVTNKPAMPSRLLLALLGALGALGAGFAVAFGLSQLSPTFHNAKDLREITGRPSLGSVSMCLSDSLKAAERRDLQRFVGAGALLLVCQAVWIGWIAMSSTI